MKDLRAGHDADLGYHQRMIADPYRMVAYERALRVMVRPGDVVLDVGAGTGVLSLWAARLGARVHAVESMGIGAVIEPLAHHHGVHDRITVHQADMRSLPIAEPVDLIVSECLGRFLVDDGMLEAMHAASRWLKPGGRIVPAAVELIVAPIELFDFAPIDTWTRPILGLDLRPLAAFAEHQTYGASIDPSRLLAAPERWAMWTPPELGPAFSEVTFTLTRGGRLRGIAAWFRALLAPSAELTNAPGHETHWQQLLFPLPARRVEAGDVLRVRVDNRDDAGDENAPTWRWSAAHERAGVVIETLEGKDGGRNVGEMIVGREPVDLDAEHDAGEAAFASGDFDGAAARFATVANGLRLDDPESTPDWENVGIALHAGGRYLAAIAPLMRALDGGVAREQSLRLLVDACFRAGHTGDGSRWLAAYEATFGPHPAGWHVTS